MRGGTEQEPTVLTSMLLSQQSWLRHGFGTRHAELDQMQMARLTQVHSSICLTADAPLLVGEGDALVTAVPGTVVSVRTADCVPILLADPRSRAVAAIHAGWRGTAGKIAQAAMAHLAAEFGSRPSDVVAAIGPSIGHCCYEVSADVATQFGVDFGVSGKGHLDLPAINRKQLEQAGLSSRNIDLVGGCTLCNVERFFSHRGEGAAAGRMIAYIGPE